MTSADIVIVGGGLAGAVTAETYRTSGGTGSVLLLSQEPNRPTHRPPLSKEYLRGNEDREKVFVHPSNFYREHDIDLRTSTQVISVDRTTRTVRLGDGAMIRYGVLVLATGARPRRLQIPGGDLPQVHYLRSIASAEQLLHASRTASRAVIIGAGFIGMEVAATLTQRGIACTVVEMAPRVWPALVPPNTASFIRRHFEEHGAQFLFGRGVQEIKRNGKTLDVVLGEEDCLSADLVVAGVGATLNTALAEQAGLSVDRGVKVDRFLRTEDPHVYAAGDIARFPDEIGGEIHLEHWDNALRQGQALGKTLAGDITPFEHVAYFFSDMFDLSLNMIGYPSAWDATAVHGDPETGAFTTIYLQDGVIRAALMVNDDTRLDEWTRAVKERQRLTAGAV